MIDSDRKPGIEQLQKMFNRCYLTVKKKSKTGRSRQDRKFLKEVLLDSYKICILPQMRCFGHFSLGITLSILPNSR